MVERWAHNHENLGFYSLVIAGSHCACEPLTLFIAQKQKASLTMMWSVDVSSVVVLYVNPTGEKTGILPASFTKTEFLNNPAHVPS